MRRLSPRHFLPLALAAAISSHVSAADTSTPAPAVVATTPPPGPATTPDAAPPAPPKPILEGYTADPHAVVFGDTYYVYPTSDKDQWLTTDFSVWSSKDLIHWKKEGMVLDVANKLGWGKIRAWAPAAIERNGKYYFYFCAEQKIGIGVADTPVGPFTDALGRPLVDRSAPYTRQQIDPQAFLDDDGQAYLYWGQGDLWVQKLNKDMVSFDGERRRINPPRRPGGNFNEGIFVFKRGGKYYFMWSENDARSADYRVAYGTSDSPLGPIKVADQPVVLQKRGLAIGTGHHSVINVPGTDRWYVVYHRHAIPNGNGYTRETCLARLEFNPDGTLREIDPLAAVFPPDSKGEPIALPEKK